MKYKSTATRDPEPDPAAAEDALWFVSPTATPDPGVQPGPRADHRRLIDAQAWRRAEAGQAAGLARAAAALAALDQRCRDLGDPGAAQRLALIEVEAMLWATGTRLPRERIGQQLRGGGQPPSDAAAMAEARWAMRRLTARPGALPDLRTFLGLHRSAAPALPEALTPRPVGAEFDLAAEGFAEGMAAFEEAHPITRAAYGFALWGLAGLSPAEACLEPAVAAARIAAAENHSLGFAPLAPGRGVWRPGGPAESRLAQWIAATRSGAQAALLELDRVSAWAEAARHRTAKIPGASPARLIAALAARPILTTEEAATQADVSRDTAERMLARMHGLGVVRELTGQGRFRLWAAG